MATLPIRDSGLRADVDDADVGVLCRRVWRLSEGYVVASDGRQLGRIIMGLPRGDARVVDHKDGDPLNNRRANLRVCTGVENGQNRAVNRNSSTGARGVTGRPGRYRARVQVAGVTYHLGYHATIERASAVAAMFRANHYAYSRT